MIVKQGDAVSGPRLSKTLPSKEMNMSRNHRAAALVAGIVALAFLFSSLAPAVRAASDDSAPKAAKKAKTSKSGQKKAAEKQADAPEKKAGQFDDNDFVESKPAGKASGANSEKTAETPAKTSDKAAEKPASGSVAKTAAKPATTVVRFSLSGEYPEGPSDEGLFGDMQPSLGKLIERLDEAKADKDVRAVWLRIEDLELGRGKVNEVRAAIARVRKAGKPVYAELTTADTGEYLVAAACDDIFMPASGMLIVPGVRAGNDLLQGPARQAGPEVRRPADGQVQGRGRAA